MSLINQSGRFRNSRFRQVIDVKIVEGKHGENGYHERYIDAQRTAIVIPTSPNDLLLLPEGERFLPSIKVYTAEPLKVGDLVRYHGTEFKIKTNADWSAYGYYNSLAIRHSETAKPDPKIPELT